MLRSTIFLAKGLREFTRGGYERAAKRFDEAVLQRSLAGRRAMVTGGRSSPGGNLEQPAKAWQFRFRPIGSGVAWLCMYGPAQCPWQFATYARPR